MIKVEKTEKGFRTYSNEGYMIKPIFDRLGKPINQKAIFVKADDIEVDGHPRFDYIETDIKREIIDENFENQGK